MANDLHIGLGLWPASGQINASDAEILDDMVARLPLADDTSLTSDSIYSAFLAAKKASDAWVKYYMISVVLLVMAAANATQDLQLFGTKILPLFVGPTAILYFSVCIVVYTNHELKMRLFRAFFQGRLRAKRGPERAQILIRYPLAFYGGAFLPWEARPKGFVVSWRHIFTTLPALGILAAGWLLAVFGLGALLFYVLHGIYQEPKLLLLVRWAIIIAVPATLIVSGAFLRGAKAKHKYTYDKIARRMPETHREI